MSLPTTVSSTEDAICLAHAALGDTDELAALVVDAQIVMPVSGEAPPDGVLMFDAVVLDAIGDLPDRMVLATRRHTGPPFVLEDELGCWRALQARHCNRELALADWLVFVRDEVVLSLAEIAGPPPDWS